MTNPETTEQEYSHDYFSVWEAGNSFLPLYKAKEEQWEQMGKKWTGTGLNPVSVWWAVMEMLEQVYQTLLGDTEDINYANNHADTAYFGLFRPLYEQENTREWREEEGLDPYCVHIALVKTLAVVYSDPTQHYYNGKPVSSAIPAE